MVRCMSLNASNDTVLERLGSDIMYPKNVDEIKKYLKENDIRPSLQRIKIYEYLATYETHPTVDEVYDALSEELMTLSKTTVYNTFDLFTNKGIVIPILVENNEIRYDHNVSKHGHFQCKNCRKIVDFDLNIDVDNINSLDEFEVDEYHIYLKGTCKECK